MPVDQRESLLVARACRGDKEAYGDLYELFLDELYRYIFYRINNEVEAEDLTEIVFLKAWEGLPGYRGDVPFKAWIYRIAHNSVVDYYRRRGRTTPLDEEAYLVEENDQPEQQAISQESSSQLVRAISKLSPLHQDVLILRFVNGYGAAETADIMEKSAGTVRVLQHRALKALRGFLAAEESSSG